MKPTTVALALGLGLATTCGAQADILKFLNNPSAQNFNVTTNLVLNADNGANVIAFKKKTPGPVVVRLTAECLANGPNGSYASVTISIRLKGTTDFVPLAPTSNDQSLCAPGTNTGLYWVSASATGGAVVPVGKHSVRVTITPNSTTAIRIDDLALTIEE